MGVAMVRRPIHRNDRRQIPILPPQSHKDVGVRYSEKKVSVINHIYCVEKTDDSFGERSGSL